MLKNKIKKSFSAPKYDQNEKNYLKRNRISGVYEEMVAERKEDLFHSILK